MRAASLDFFFAGIDFFLLHDGDAVEVDAFPLRIVLFLFGSSCQSLLDDEVVELRDIFALHFVEQWYVVLPFA